MKYTVFTVRETKTEYKVTNPSIAFKVLQKYKDESREQFIVLTLNSDSLVIGCHVISVGVLDKTLVHPREVFLPAIQDRAKSIIVAHNHPSGRLDPSQDDINTIKRLKDSGELLGIPVLDSLIFHDSFVSMAELGLML